MKRTLYTILICMLTWKVSADTDKLLQFWKTKTNHATGATKACNLLIIRRSSVQNRGKIELLSCTNGATESGFRVTQWLQISPYVDGDIFFASKEIFLTR